MVNEINSWRVLVGVVRIYNEYLSDVWNEFDFHAFEITTEEQKQIIKDLKIMELEVELMLNKLRTIVDSEVYFDGELLTMEFIEELCDCSSDVR